MNLKLLIFSTFLITALHYAVLTYSFKQEPIKIDKPKYQKVSLQMAHIKKTPQVKKIEKQEIKKQVFNKPIKKEAKRELVKKKTPKVKKKIVKKVEKKKVSKTQTPKKVIQKKILTKTIKEKVPEQKVVEKQIRKIDKSANKNTTQYLEKYKQFKTTYLTQVRAKIDKNKKYPNISRRLKEQGKVYISFRILKSGLFTNIKVKRSSNKKRLDKAALNAVKEAFSHTAFNKNIKKEFMDITIPISFTLR